MSQVSDYLEALEVMAEPEEIAFFEEFLEAVENDWDAFFVGFKEYEGAVEYLMHKAGKLIILNEDALEDGRRALARLRLSHVLSKCIAKEAGTYELNKALGELIKEHDMKVYQKVDEVIGEKIEKVYDKLEVMSETDVLEDMKARAKNGPIDLVEYLREIFNDRPVLVDFPKIFRDEFHKVLAQFDGERLVDMSTELACYLANFIWHEDKWAYTEILPAACHIVREMPKDVDDEPHNEAAGLYWVASDVIDRCWRYISEGDDEQRRFRDMVYELYAPRVGAMWPMANRNRFDFKQEATGQMFDEASGMILALDDIAERNWEIGEFLRKVTKNDDWWTLPEMVARRAFIYKTKNLDAEEYFSAVIDELGPEAWESFLDYPRNLEAAGVVLSELFRTGEGSAFGEGRVRMAVLEKLLMSPHTLGVGVEILNFITDRLDKLQKIVKMVLKNLNEADAPRPLAKLSDVEVMTSLFEAACIGITELNELKPLKKMMEGMEKLGCEKTRLEKAMKYARAQQRKIAFQRATLDPIFERDDWGMKIA